MRETSPVHDKGRAKGGQAVIRLGPRARTKDRTGNNVGTSVLTFPFPPTGHSFQSE